MGVGVWCAGFGVGSERCVSCIATAISCRKRPAGERSAVGRDLGRCSSRVGSGCSSIHISYIYKNTYTHTYQYTYVYMYTCIYIYMHRICCRERPSAVGRDLGRCSSRAGSGCSPASRDPAEPSISGGPNLTQNHAQFQTPLGSNLFHDHDQSAWKGENRF